jgi:ACS family hexuronate transporter-like MFS transporter
MIAYAVMQGVSGRIIDRIGTRIGMAGSIVWWSLAGMAHALAGGLWGFRLVRFLLGAGEAGNWPGAAKVVSEWFPARQRGLAVAIFDSGASIGGIVAPPLVTWFILHAGWRVTFLVTGALGFLWLVPWLLLYSSPEHSRFITKNELDLILDDRRKEHRGPEPVVPWRSLLHYRQVWGLILGRLLTDCVWWFYVFWLPKYLTDRHGFTLAQIGMLGWIPFLAVDAGNLGGGWLSGVLVRRGWSLNAARKLVLVLGAGAMVAGLPAGLTGNPALCLALIAAANLGYAAWGTMMLTLPSDLFPSSAVASVSGLSGMGAGLGGILFTVAAGRVIDRVSYTPVFLAMGLMPVLALLLVLALIPMVAIVVPRETQPAEAR